MTKISSSFSPATFILNFKPYPSVFLSLKFIVNNSLTWKGVEEMCNTECARLREMDVSGNGIGGRGLGVICWKKWKCLALLNLSTLYRGYCVGNTGILGKNMVNLLDKRSTLHNLISLNLCTRAILQFL